MMVGPPWALWRYRLGAGYTIIENDAHARAFWGGRQKRPPNNNTTTTTTTPTTPTTTSTTIILRRFALICSIFQ
eukprot:7690557-Pyramimonas_sp.AAC.1